MDFAGYLVEGQVGAGSTGVVWLANQVGVDRRVAIKQLAPDLADDVAFRERFRAEAQVLASLRHPNVVDVYDYVESADGSYIVEELVEGASLDQVMTAAGPLSPSQAAGVLRGALNGLAAVHERGLVHGDVSPSNILVDTTGTSKLVDFGLTSSEGSSGPSGAPGYASPEALRGEPVDSRADVYSAGRVLFALLTGRPPAQGPPAQSVDPGGPTMLHGQLADVVARATATAPSERYPDAAAFLAALEQGANTDLGPDWVLAAGIASLVAATTLTAGATIVAESASATAGVSSTTTAAGHSGKVASFASHHAPAVAIAAVVSLATIAVAIIFAIQGGTKAPNPLVGTYNFTRTVTNGNITSPTGTVDHYSENFSCVGSPCRLQSKDWANLTFSGQELRSQASVPNQSCGKRGTYTLNYVIDLHIAAFSTDTHGHKMASRLTGTGHFSAADLSPGCGINDPITASLAAVRQN